jgi:hypothetical protein
MRAGKTESERRLPWLWPGENTWLLATKCRVAPDKMKLLFSPDYHLMPNVSAISIDNRELETK